MQLTTLGTSSGTPTKLRNVTSAALRFDDGRVWLIDCGEATQHQLLSQPLRPGRIERILLTHLHGDHCYGLPGILASLAVHGRTDPVDLVGPPGIAEWVEVTARVSQLTLGYALRIHELEGRWQTTTPTGEVLTAVPIPHRVPCWGYRISEAPRPGRFDAAKAAAAGVTQKQDIARLAGGEDVTLFDGTLVKAGGLRGPTRPGRSAAVFGDTSGADASDPAWHDCDLMVHECTYAADRSVDAEKWGHATTTIVGQFAAAVRPRQLVITHFSSRYTAPGAAVSVEDLVAEVQALCPGVPVLPAADGSVFPVLHPGESDRAAGA